MNVRRQSMKKLLSAIGLIAILGMTSPVLAAPGGHGGPVGHGPGGPRGPHGGGHHHISAGHHHRHHVRPHGGFTVHAGHPRHHYWYGYRSGYWGGPYCNYRLGWCDPYLYPGIGVHVPMGGASFSLRF